MIYNAYAGQTEEICGIRLVSCGHIFAEPGREIYRPRGREDWLLFYVAKESETFFLPQEVTAKQGGCILFAPGEPQHHIYQGDKTAEFYYIHFRCAQLPESVSLETFRVYDLPFRPQICSLFEEILEETLRKQPCYEQLCLYRFLQLLTMLQREVIHTSHPQKENFDRIALAVQHMNRYYSSDLSLSEYAQMCSMSKYHFLRMFAQITGSTPLEYRANLRLAHAAELLREERLTVEEIAAMTGFSSAAYFSSAFKRKFGLPPKKFQQEASLPK